MDFVMSGEQVVKYTEDRFFKAKDFEIDPRELRAVIQVNNITTGGLMRTIARENGHSLDEKLKLWVPDKGIVVPASFDYKGIRPVESYEEHVYIPEMGLLLIANPIGLVRGERTESTIRAALTRGYQDVSFEFFSSYFDPEDIISSSEHFQRMGRKVVRKLYELFEDKVKDNPSFSANDLLDITNITFGPLNKINQHEEWKDDVVQGQEITNSYLPFEFREVDGKTVLCFDYIFGDQVDFVLTPLIAAYRMMAEQEERDIELNISGFGKYGGNHPDLSRSSVVVPIGAIDERDIVDGINVGRVSYRNRFASPELYEVLKSHAKDQVPVMRALTLNAETVINQRMEVLRSAEDLGAFFLDMESFYFANRFNRRAYAGRKVKINYGFLGDVSDNPQYGSTIDKRHADTRGSDACLSTIRHTITQQSL